MVFMSRWSKASANRCATAWISFTLMGRALLSVYLFRHAPRETVTEPPRIPPPPAQGRGHLTCHLPGREDASAAAAGRCRDIYSRDAVCAYQPPHLLSF